MRRFLTSAIAGKWAHSQLFFFVGVLIVGLSSFANAGLLTGEVNAACPHKIDLNVSSDPSNPRHSDNSPGKVCNEENRQASGLSAERFAELRNQCEGVDSARGTGGPFGAGNVVVVPFSSETGNCSNAIASCYKHVQVQANCEDPLLLAWIAECNEGDVGAPMTAGGASPYGVGGMQDGCGTEGAIKNVNEIFGKDLKSNADFVDERRESYYKKICTAESQAKELNKKAQDVTESDITRCKDDLRYQTRVCADRVIRENGGEGLGDRAQLSDEEIEAKNKACLQKYAKTEAACDLREGIWVKDDTIDPDQSLPTDKRNSLKSGCYYQSTDLTNPEACRLGAEKTGRDFQWQRTDKPQTPQTEAWGCVDQANPEGEGVDPEEEKEVKPVDGEIGSVSGKCGSRARTNLIICEDNTEGKDTINNVLKIFVMVLSVGVGIAAVGGLAFSAAQYAQAGDNESTVSAAKERIRNIVIGILLYGFLLAIVNWLVPGGMF